MTLKAVIKVSHLILIRKGIAKVEQKVSVYVKPAAVPNLKLWGLFFLMPLSTLRIPKIAAEGTISRYFSFGVKLLFCFFIVKIKRT